MHEPPRAPTKPVERLFPFAVRARLLVPGRSAAFAQKKRLQFLLITRDLTANSKREVRERFTDCPIVECYEAGQLEKFFGVSGAKIVGFRKSSLAASIHRELKEQFPEPPALEPPLPQE